MSEITTNSEHYSRFSKLLLEKLRSEIKKYSDHYNRLSRLLLENLYNDKKDQNIVFSPFSILMILAIVSDATAGRTRDEIAGVLSSDMSYEDVICTLREISKIFTANKAFISSNAVCVNNTIASSIVPAYANHLREQFGGKLFSSADIVSDVNSWVKKHTFGMIDTIADDSMRNSLVCMMNASAFLGKWTKHYTRNDILYKEFRNSDGTKKETALLKLREYEYIENDNFTGFVKPYKDVDFSFMALLPKQETDAGMKQALHSLNLSDLFNLRIKETVMATLPEFKYSFDEDLTGLCRKSGIEVLFSEHADFTPLASEWLKITAIIHKTRIEVNRNGTKAAAATVAFACAAGVPQFNYKVVKLDRPFVYAIVHNTTGLPVFTGIVNKL